MVANQDSLGGFAPPSYAKRLCSATSEGIPVKHASQNFCGHHHDLGIGVDCDITSQQPHILELLLQLSELLIAKSLVQQKISQRLGKESH